jgi:hypothetical protein
LYFAASRNCGESILLAVGNGADPDARGFKDNIPILAWTIMNFWTQLDNGTETIRALVALSALAEVILSDLWEDYLQTPSVFPLIKPSKARQDTSECNDENASWCTQGYRQLLAKSLNLTMRYLLHTRSKHRPSPDKILEIAQYHNMTRFLTLPFYLVGQNRAVEELKHIIYAHLASNDTKDYQQPLVFVFAGPSGHGKTELARHMGELLGVKPLEKVCTGFKSEMDLFGPKSPTKVGRSDQK